MNSDEKKRLKEEYYNTWIKPHNPLGYHRGLEMDNYMKWLTSSFPYPHNRNMPDFKKHFENFSELLKSEKSFTLARICDGEIYAMSFKKSHNGSVSDDDIKYLSRNLHSLIDLSKEKDNLIIGLQENTVWNTSMGINPYTKKISHGIKNKIPASLISWSTVTGYFKQVVEIINNSERPLIIVGPQHLRRIQIFKKNTKIIVPSNNCWKHEDKVQPALISAIEDDSNPIIIYSCSILAKNLILKNYLLFGDNVIQLDLGSNLDPYCNVESRPWHESLNKKG